MAFGKLSNPVMTVAPVVVSQKMLQTRRKPLLNEVNQIIAMARLLNRPKRTKMPPQLRNHHETAILVYGDDKATNNMPTVKLNAKACINALPPPSLINKRHKGWNQHRAGKTHDQNADNPNNG